MTAANTNSEDKTPTLGELENACDELKGLQRQQYGIGLQITRAVKLILDYAEAMS